MPTASTSHQLRWLRWVRSTRWARAGANRDPAVNAAADSPTDPRPCSSAARATASRVGADAVIINRAPRTVPGPANHPPDDRLALRGAGRPPAGRALGTREPPATTRVGTSAPT